MASSSFIFTLQEYARELISLVDAMGRICNIERANAAHSGPWSRLKSLFGCDSSTSRGVRSSDSRKHTDLRKRLCMSVASSSLDLCYQPSFPSTLLRWPAQTA